MKCESKVDIMFVDVKENDIWGYEYTVFGIHFHMISCFMVMDIVFQKFKFLSHSMSYCYFYGLTHYRYDKGHNGYPCHIPLYK